MCTNGPEDSAVWLCESVGGHTDHLLTLHTQQYSQLRFLLFASRSDSHPFHAMRPPSYQNDVTTCGHRNYCYSLVKIPLRRLFVELVRPRADTEDCHAGATFGSQRGEKRICVLITSAKRFSEAGSPQAETGIAQRAAPLHYVSV
jgi:hypothetical protein